MDNIIATIDERQQGGFDIKCYAIAEDESPRGQFSSGDAEADAQIQRDIDSGKLEWFMVKVTASKVGVVLATDYLGGCCYKSFAEFVEQDDYYSDMRAVVISDALTTLKKLNA